MLKSIRSFICDMKKGDVIAILVIVSLIYLVLPYRTISQPDGVLVDQQPVQGPLWQNAKAILNYKGYAITPLADYDITARVLERNIYNTAGSDLSTLDLFLGWGAMSDSARLKDLEISCALRYCLFRAPSVESLKDVEGHVANTHTIPMTDAVQDKLDDLRVGHIVRLKGYLVRITGEGGFVWSSSLTRDDQGDGACEVMLVTEVEIMS